MTATTPDRDKRDPSPVNALRRKIVSDHAARLLAAKMRLVVTAWPERRKRER